MTTTNSTNDKPTDAVDQAVKVPDAVLDQPLSAFTAGGTVPLQALNPVSKIDST